MSWFAVRDEDGKYWDFEGMDDYRKPLSATNRGRKWAEEVKANTCGSEIIEVVEKTAPIVVSEEESEMLERAHDENCYAVNVLRNYIIPFDGTMSNSKFEKFSDRLMRAYVNGYTVEKPKLWNVKVPHMNGWYYFKMCGGESLSAAGDFVGGDSDRQFTLEEIERYGLQDCEKVECDNND